MNDNDNTLNRTHTLWAESDMYWLAGLLLDSSEDGEFSEHVRALRDERTADEAKADREDLCHDVTDALVTYGLLDAHREGHVPADRFVRLASNPEALERAREAVQKGLDDTEEQSLPSSDRDADGQREVIGESRQNPAPEKPHPVGDVTRVFRKYGISEGELNIKMDLLIRGAIKLITTESDVRTGDVLKHFRKPASQQRLNASFRDNFAPVLAEFFSAERERASVLNALSKDKVVTLFREVGLSRTFLAGRLSSLA